jgi:hypothetical protein
MKLLPCAVLFLPLCLAAQSDPPVAQASASAEVPAPAEVVAPAEALRAQAKKFYDALVKGKPRLAQAFVCEANQDDFYSRPKPMFLTAVVDAIEMAQDGKSAAVTSMVQLDLMIRIPGGPGKMPVVSKWLLEGGNWCFVPDSRGSDKVVSSFGSLQLRPGLGGPAMMSGASGPPPGAIASASAAASAAQASTVRFSKTALRLPPGAGGEDSLEIVNGSMAEVIIECECAKSSGIRCELSATTLGRGKAARLRVSHSQSDGSLRADSSAKVTIRPFGREVIVPITSR